MSENMFHLYNSLIAHPFVEAANGYHEIINGDVSIDDLYRLYDISKHCKHYHVYCSPAGYTNLIIAYIKQHLPYCNNYDAYILYKTSIDSYNINNNFIKSSNNKWICIEDFAPFNAKFEQNHVCRDASFNKVCCMSLSNQYKIASLLCGQQKYNQNLIDIFRKCILRHCQDTIYELINIVLNNVFVIENKSLCDDITNPSVDIVKKCFDNTLLHEFQNYEYDVLVPKILDFVNWINKNSKKSSWLSLPDSDILNNDSYVQLLLQLKKTDAISIIDYQLGIRDHYYGDVVFSYSEKPIINLMVLFEIYRRYADKNFEALQRWSIGE